MAPTIKNKKLSTGSGDFDISDLPSDVLEHILSFMSSREAVRTSILSKPWRYLWKYVYVLRISETVEECNKFLGNFLLVRNQNPINICDIKMNDHETVEMHDVVDTWIFHVVGYCHVRELRVIICIEDDFLWLRNRALVSKFLKKLELHKVHLEAKTADFSSCPVLEEIELMYCTIKSKYIISKSVKFLIAEECEFSDTDTRAHISVPSLVFLVLIGICNCIPLLEGMPLLEYAYVRLGENCIDFCQYNKSWGCNTDCSFPCIDDDKEGTILLEGLSNATQLELLNEPDMFIFERDMRRCPKFRNLRTLIVNEWFLVPNISGLLCILRNSPFLDELNLILQEEPELLVESNGEQNQMEHLLSLGNLKEVKVTCQRKYMWIEKLVKNMIASGISSEIITIKEKFMYSDLI